MNKSIYLVNRAGSPKGPLPPRVWWARLQTGPARALAVSSTSNRGGRRAARACDQAGAGFRHPPSLRCSGLGAGEQEDASSAQPDARTHAQAPTLRPAEASPARRCPLLCSRALASAQAPSPGASSPPRPRPAPGRLPVSCCRSSCEHPGCAASAADQRCGPVSRGPPLPPQPAAAFPTAPQAPWHLGQSPCSVLWSLDAFWSRPTHFFQRALRPYISLKGTLDTPEAVARWRGGRGTGGCAVRAWGVKVQPLLSEPQSLHLNVGAVMTAAPIYPHRFVVRVK